MALSLNVRPAEIDHDLNGGVDTVLITPHRVASGNVREKAGARDGEVAAVGALSGVRYLASGEACDIAPSVGGRAKVSPTIEDE